MFNDRFNRHTLAFLTMGLSSAILYFAAHAGSMTLLWGLLVLNALAALLVLNTK
jgi:hypothetical protein